MKVRQIREFIQNKHFTESLKLDEATYIKDLNLFFESHLSVLSGGADRRMKIPYHYRLCKAIFLINKLNIKFETLTQEQNDEKNILNTLENINKNKSSLKPNTDF